MSDERPKGFLSRVFGPVEEDHTSVYSSRDDEFREDGDPQGIEEAEDEPIEETGRSFTVERAAEIIKHLPPEVPRSSAVRIVRQTLVAAGIDMDDLTRSTESREEKLNSEIERREGKIEDLRQRTDETVRDLERRIREAREDRDAGVAAEERRISTARGGLEDVGRVREFFDLPKGVEVSDQGTSAEPPDDDDYDSGNDASVSDETQIIERPHTENDDDTRIINRSQAEDSRSGERRNTGENRL